MTKEIILDTDEDIVEYRINIEGWVGRDGRFYGKDKNLAIYANSTHKKCEKGHIYGKSWLKCQECQEAERPSKYLQLQYKEWDKITPLNLYMTDKYFFNIDDIEEYSNEEEVNMEDLELVVCVPNHLWRIEDNVWEDILPEDMDLKEITSAEFRNKLKELNNIIDKEPPISWNGGKYRTSVDRIYR